MSLRRLALRRAIVTGAGSGIGRAIAIRFAQEGAQVAVADINLNAAQETVQMLETDGFAFQINVSQAEQHQALIARVLKTWGGLEIMVNNAGVGVAARVENTSEEDWDRIMNVNLKSVFFLSRAAGNAMKPNRWGRIVNVSSTGGRTGGIFNATVYSASKAGIMSMTKAFARECAPLGIRVNTFAPGPVNVARNLRDDPDYRDVWGAMIPLGRTAETEEMVGPALFLASADSSYMTGQTFFVDGGWTVQGRVPASNVEKAAQKNK